MQRVVTDTRVEADLEVVGLPASRAQNPAHLPAEVALHFQHEAGGFERGIVSPPADELVDVGIHTGRRFPRPHRAEHHDAGVEAALGHGEPRGLGRRARHSAQMRLAQDQRRRRTRLGFWVRRQGTRPHCDGQRDVTMDSTDISSDTQKRASCHSAPYRTTAGHAKGFWAQ